MIEKSPGAEIKTERCFSFHTWCSRSWVTRRRVVPRQAVGRTEGLELHKGGQAGGRSSDGQPHGGREQCLIGSTSLVMVSFHYLPDISFAAAIDHSAAVVGGPLSISSP